MEYNEQQQTLYEFPQTSCITRLGTPRTIAELGDEVMVRVKNVGWQIGIIKEKHEHQMVLEINSDHGPYNIAITQNNLAAILVSD